MLAAREARPLGLLGLVGLFAAALAVFAVAPASADSQQVRLEDNAFMLPAVAVRPGESVTWTNPGPDAGATDVHNVNFEDGMFTRPGPPQRGPWGPETRSFTTAGTYLYFCEEHGGAGRQGMSGVVYVNATGTVPGAPPTASFTTSPSVARVNQNVVFDAAATSDPDDAIVRHEWDLDGNGSYETDTGRISRTALSYSTPGMRTIKLRVTDNQGHINETTRSLSVTNEPVASFTASPSPVQTDQMVNFNGSASSDPDGGIAKYEWDLDGNGSYETVTGSTPTTSRSYASPGTLSVKLRVTDNLGVTSETTRSLQVNAAPPASPPGKNPPPQARGCRGLKGAKRAACMRKSCRRVKGNKRAACMRKSCRRVKGNKRAACIRKSCRYEKRSKRNSCKRKSCRTLKGAKKREACVRKYSRRRRS